MFCTRCGTSLPEGAKFCVVCGQAVNRNMMEPNVGESLQKRDRPDNYVQMRNVSDRPAQKSGQQKRSKKPFLVIGIVAVAVICIVAGVGIFLLTGRSKNEQSSSSYESVAANGSLEDQSEENAGNSGSKDQEEFVGKLIYLPVSVEHSLNGSTETDYYTVTVEGNRISSQLYHEELLVVDEEREYDQAGRITYIKYSYPSGYWMEYLREYDDAGDMVCETRVYYNTTVDAESETKIFYTYNEEHMVTGIADADNSEYTLEFNNDGTLKAFDWRSNENKIHFEYTYEGGYLQSSIMQQTPSEDQLLEMRNYYDGTGFNMTDTGRLLYSETYTDNVLVDKSSYEYQTAVVTDEGIQLLD